MFLVCLCYAILFIQCSLVITSCERANLYSLLCVVFSCVCFFLTFPYDVLGQVYYTSKTFFETLHDLNDNETTRMLKTHQKIPTESKVMQV